MPAWCLLHRRRNSALACEVEPSSISSRCIAWARQVFDALMPHATGGVYVNFMADDETQRVSASAYGMNYARLAQLKAKFDPANLFCQNQNIRPQG